MNIIKRGQIITILLISIILSVSTHILPIFLQPPKWILLNIAGMFLVSYALGPVYGIMYAGVLNAVLSSIGMGSGIVIYALVTQMIEAGLIGVLRFKRIKGFLNVTLISFVLSVVIKPIGIFMYSIFNGEVSSIITNIINIYISYLKTEFIVGFITYLMSGVLAYVVYSAINKIILKRKGANIYEKI